MDHLSPLEMPGQVANHSGLFVASPLACPSDNSHANRQQSARSVQKKSSYPERTVRSARVLEADGRLFDRGFLQHHHGRRGPSGTKLSSLVTRAIRPGYGALSGSDLSR
jgi:hypothetical protein